MLTLVIVSMASNNYTYTDTLDNLETTYSAVRFLAESVLAILGKYQVWAAPPAPTVQPAPPITQPLGN